MMLARVAAATLLTTATYAQDLNADPTTARDMLFSNPGAELPDVYLSESVVFVEESDAGTTNEQTYTVVLTHPPGMREDETIDLDNDEVRIYLTSSQEVFQQDDQQGATVQFEQRRGHRTQLIISTNDVDNDNVIDSVSSLADVAPKFGSADATVWSASTNSDAAAGFDTGTDLSPEILLPLGPLPYVYKTFSTVGGNVPTQQSPVIDVGGTMTLASVCPVCTHPAYCVLYDGTQHDLVDIPPRTCVNDADAPRGGCATSTPADPRHDATVTELGTTDFNILTLTGSERIIKGSTIAGVGTAPAFQGCWQVKISYAPVMDMCAENPDVVVSDLNPLKGPCQKPQDGFTVYDGLLPRQAGGSHPDAVGWSYESPVEHVHTTPGNSDFRIDEIGDQVLRTRSDPRPLCRYSNCPELTVNGGDQQPESANFLYPTWTTGASWRGDLSSSAQLVFDSTNYNEPQKVTVVARADDVYEPEVNNRGQDAYVHHFVVAQDINLEHTYYDDIEVNDLTVSITDDDPAVVIENANEVNPTEGVDAEIKLRLDRHWVHRLGLPAEWVILYAWRRSGVQCGRRRYHLQLRAGRRAGHLPRQGAIQHVLVDHQHRAHLHVPSRARPAIIVPRSS
jgi:hypothetical protein